MASGSNKEFFNTLKKMHRWDSAFVISGMLAIGSEVLSAIDAGSRIADANGLVPDHALHLGGLEKLGEINFSQTPWYQDKFLLGTALTGVALGGLSYFSNRRSNKYFNQILWMR